MRHGALLLAFAIPVALASACASSARRNAGTGDIAFRLLWEGPADLDLYVISPLDEPIDFTRRVCESGGQLDVDCNAAPDRMCARPIENVFWPVGRAPSGEYRVWVQLANVPSGEEAAAELSWTGVDFRLQILRGARVAQELPGHLSERGEKFGPFDIPYSRESGRGPSS
jgi:hypothetical protein